MDQEAVDLVIGENLGAIVEHVAQVACLIAVEKLIIGEEDGRLAEQSLFVHGYAPFLTEVFPCALIQSGNRLDWLQVGMFPLLVAVSEAVGQPLFLPPFFSIGYLLPMTVSNNIIGKV